MRFPPASSLVIACLLASLNALPATAENWPHWRGPTWNGSTDETNLPDHWDQGKNVAWIAALPGRSGATPVIWEDSVFLPSPDADGNLLLLCLDSKTGKIRWKREVAPGNAVRGKNNMASPSAVTDGKRVAVMFGTGDLAAYDFEGKQLWSCNLANEYGKLALMWIYGSSPLLYRDKLYVEVLQRSDPAVYRHAADDKPTRDSFLLCLDPQSGKKLWRQVRKNNAREESQEAYTSPIVRPTERGAEILLFGGDCLTSHDPETGVELWRSGSLNPKKSPVWRTIVSPVAGAEEVFVCLPRTFNPSLAISPGKAGTKAVAAVAWQSSEASADVPTPLYYRGKLFVLDGNRQKLICVDPKTGSTQWSGRLETDEIFSASPTGADGKVYCISEGGTVVVLSAGKEFKIISRFALEAPGEQAGLDPNGVPLRGGSAESGPTLSTIAVANGHLFVRTAKYLYCIGAKP